MEFIIVLLLLTAIFGVSFMIGRELAYWIK